IGFMVDKRAGVLKRGEDRGVNGIEMRKDSSGLRLALRVAASRPGEPERGIDLPRPQGSRSAGRHRSGPALPRPVRVQSERVLFYSVCWSARTCPTLRPPPRVVPLGAVRTASHLSTLLPLELFACLAFVDVLGRRPRAAQSSAKSMPSTASCLSP